jgi:hypothetical protein
LEENSSFPRQSPSNIKSANQQISKLMFEDSVKKAAAGARAEAIHGQLSEKPRPLVQPRWGQPMTQDADVQGLQSKAESRLASLKNEKLVTRIAVVSTLLGPGKITKRLMIGMSVETHKTSPDFDHEKCGQAKSRIMRALDDIDCDVFIEMDR